MGISMFWTVGACFEALAEAEGAAAIPIPAATRPCTAFVMPRAKTKQNKTAGA